MRAPFSPESRLLIDLSSSGRPGAGRSKSHRLRTAQPGRCYRTTRQPFGSAGKSKAGRSIPSVGLGSHDGCTAFSSRFRSKRILTSPHPGAVVAPRASPMPARLIDVHCNWLWQYTPETTTFTPQAYPAVSDRLKQLAGYMTATSAAVLCCDRSSADWDLQADPWRSLGDLIVRYEAEFAGRLLIGPADLERWRTEPPDWADLGNSWNLRPRLSRSRSGRLEAVARSLQTGRPGHPARGDLHEQAGWLGRARRRPRADRSRIVRVSRKSPRSGQVIQPQAVRSSTSPI